MINPLKYLKRYKNVNSVLLDRNGLPAEFAVLKDEDGMAKDFAMGTAYGPIAEAAVIKDDKGKYWRLFDAKTGAAIRFEWGEAFTHPFDYTDPTTGKVRKLRLETTPSLLFRAFDRANISNMFSRSASYAIVLMGMAMAAAIGWAVAASVYGG